MAEDIKKPWFMFDKDTEEDNNELPYEDDFLSEDFSDTDANYDDLASDLIDKAENMARFLPESAEVLGNCIIYNMEDESFARAKYYYEHLKKLDISLYGVKAYMGIIKYEMTNPTKNESSLRKYISKFKDKFPANEEPYVREALLEQCLGNYEKAHELLKEAIKNVVNPVNAYAMLAKIELDQKKNCCETVIKALSSTIREDSKLAALLSLYFVMSHEGELEEKMANGESISPNDFNKVIKDYEDLLKFFGLCKSIYQEKINERIGLLQFWRNRYEYKKET